MGWPNWVDVDMVVTMKVVQGLVCCSNVVLFGCVKKDYISIHPFIFLLCFLPLPLQVADVVSSRFPGGHAFGAEHFGGQFLGKGSRLLAHGRQVEPFLKNAGVGT